MCAKYIELSSKQRIIKIQKLKSQEYNITN